MTSPKCVTINLQEGPVSPTFSATSFQPLLFGPLPVMTLVGGDQNSEFEGPGNYHCDFIPITIPHGLRRVMNITRDTPELSNVLVRNPSEGAYGSYLVQNLRPQLENETINEDFLVNHACRPEGKEYEIRDGGQGCSTLISVNGTSQEPVVFYLHRTSTGVADGLETYAPRKMNHFMIPTLLPNRSILWVAIEKGGQPEVVTAQEVAYLKLFTSSSIRVFAFKRNPVFLDEVGITIFPHQRQADLSGEYDDGTRKFTLKPPPRSKS